MILKFYNILYYIFFLWILGIEQIFFTPYFLYLKYRYNKSIKVNIPTAFLLIILFFMIISFINIESTIKLLQLASRNIFSFIGAILIFTFFSENSKNLFSGLNTFISIIAWSSFIIVFSGFLPLVGFNFEFETLLYPFFKNISFANNFSLKHLQIQIAVHFS